MSFNYIDAFSQSSQIEYESKQHDAAIQLQGRRCYVFLLDRKNTELSEVYNEAVGSRIYLPHFEQRGLYDTNQWTTNIGLNNVVETEETLKIEFNFARMVFNIRDLKDRTAGSLVVKNTSKEVLRLSTENNRFFLRTSKSVVLLDMDLTIYKSIKQFINAACQKCSLIEMSYAGDMEEAKAISSINMKLYPNRKESISVADRTYKDCQEVIWPGDIILTDKYKLYQVNNAYPTNHMINDYTGWSCHCNTIDLAMASLPDDYRKIVTRNNRGLKKTTV